MSSHVYITLTDTVLSSNTGHFANILVHHRSYILEMETWLPVLLSLAFVVAVSSLICVIAKKKMLSQPENRSYYRE